MLSKKLCITARSLPMLSTVGVNFALAWFCYSPPDKTVPQSMMSLYVLAGSSGAHEILMIALPIAEKTIKRCTEKDNDRYGRHPKYRLNFNDWKSFIVKSVIDLSLLGTALGIIFNDEMSPLGLNTSLFLGIAGSFSILSPALGVHNDVKACDMEDDGTVLLAARRNQHCCTNTLQKLNSAGFIICGASIIVMTITGIPDEVKSTIFKTLATAFIANAAVKVATFLDNLGIFNPVKHCAYSLGSQFKALFSNR